jgi:hypothetical protein
MGCSQEAHRTPPKSPGTVAGESAAGEETATMLRRHYGLRRAKCVLIESNSASFSGGVEPRKFGGHSWRRNLAATSAGRATTISVRCLLRSGHSERGVLRLVVGRSGHWRHTVRTAGMDPLPAIRWPSTPNGGFDPFATPGSDPLRSVAEARSRRSREGNLYRLNVSRKRRICSERSEEKMRPRLRHC